jgi:ERCC4-type nuclease
MPPRGKDTKVWNEDLVIALSSREELCRQQFSQRQYLWRDGATAIASIRKDIYQYKSSGKIVGLPRNLTKSVEDECRAIIEGTSPILPVGYVPTTLEERKMAVVGDGSASAEAIKINPYHKDPYLNKIKMRGGSYSILIAFHFSETKTMTKSQLCTAAQNFCDEEMEPNFYSGRSYGAWSSKKTLIKHGLIKECRSMQMGRKGHMCNGVFEYTLTENGVLFNEALLKKFPQTDVSSIVSHLPKVNNNTHQTKHCLEPSLKKPTTKISEIKSEDKNNIKECLGTKYFPHSSLHNPKNEKKSIIEDWLSSSESDNDSDDDSFELSFKHLNKPNNSRGKKHAQHQMTVVSEKQLPPKIKVPDVIDLVDSDDESESDSELIEIYHPRKTYSTTDRESLGLLKSRENIPENLRSIKDTEKIPSTTSKLVIIIDNRERNRNATPRHMRMELTRHLSKTTGPLRQVWPSHLPIGEVEETQLNYGDFAFALKSKQLGTTRRLPVSIERKRLSDLVQRSHQADHWKQLQRMRDCCEHAILLIEGNTKKVSNFSSYDNNIESEVESESWNPDHHTIDDEHAFYRFVARGILSSSSLKILQTKDEQASYRSIGATGLVASLLPWEKDAPKTVPYTKVTVNKLYNKLKTRGIPWQIARRISEELGSIEQLDRIYEHCDGRARTAVLLPIIKESCSGMIETEDSRSLLQYGQVETWSTAIYSAWYTKLNDPSQVVGMYEEYKFFANDRAQLLTALHRGKTAERAVQESNIKDEISLREMNNFPRRVRIESCSNFLTIFPSDVETETFYKTICVEENPLGMILPTIVMQTTYCSFQSDKLIVCVLEGNDFFQRIQDAATSQSAHDFIEISKEVAEQINLECSSFLLSPKNDRRILLIRGLGPTMNAAAKGFTYRAEYKILTDLIIAELMLRHKLVVVHAYRLASDMEMILREFAMGCFYYQLTNRKIR